MKAEININTNILTWAINRAGFEFNEFILNFPKVQEWIDNKKKPTIKQLEDFSKKVHLPFGYLFLPEPPKEKLPIPFFRTFDTQQATNLSVNVYDTILLMQQRQEWLNQYLKDNDFDPLPFVGKFYGKSDYLEIVTDIRKVLNLPNEWASSFSKMEDTLEHLTQRIEDNGIVINFNSIVENNTHRPIKVDECRGFVLVDKMAPLMFVNAADGKAAQLFTIVHELAHIWTGHSAGFDFRQFQVANDPIEILCDKVAAEFLVPKDSFNRLWQERQEIPYLAKHFKVSPIVIARRALDLGKIEKPAFFSFYNSYIKDLQDKKDKQSGGGDFYATTKKRISLTFAAHINQAVKTNKLLYRDAYKLTGLKGDTYHSFFQKHF
jgi:Zn-dependent peptidase ImmA (M78 family)